MKICDFEDIDQFGYTNLTEIVNEPICRQTCEDSNDCVYYSLRSPFDYVCHFFQTCNGYITNSAIMYRAYRKYRNGNQ